MDNCHQESRRAAAQSFMQSLTQLEATLLETTPPVESPPVESAAAAPPALSPAAPPPGESPKFDSSFEEAAADIEQFIRERQQRKG